MAERADGSVGLLTKAQLGLETADGTPVTSLGSNPGRSTACWEHFQVAPCSEQTADTPCQPYIDCMRALHPDPRNVDQDYWKRYTRNPPFNANGTMARASGALSQGCPTPSTVDPLPVKTGRQKYDDIKGIMDSMGASQECKSRFDNEVNSDFTKVDAVMSACATPLGSIGPEARLATTNAENDIRTEMEESGCLEIMMAVNKQVISEINMTCELNNTSNTSAVQTVSRNSISIQTTYVDPGVKRAMITAMGSPPVPPSNHGYRYKNREMFEIAGKIYDKAAAHYIKMQRAIGGDATIRGSTFKVKSGLRIKTVSKTDAATKATLIEDMEATIHSQAESDIQREVGFGATDSENVRQLVQNSIDSNREAIATMVNNSIQQTNITTSNTGEITLFLPPNFTIENTTFSADTEIDIVAESLMNSARDFGRSISMSILSEAAASGEYSSTSGGVDEALKAIGEAQAALSKANKPYNDSVLGSSIFGVVAVIGVLLIAAKVLGGKGKGKGGNPIRTRIMIGVFIIVAFVLIYIAFAWWNSFWPFSPSEERKGNDIEIPSFGKSRTGVNVPMQVPELKTSSIKSNNYYNLPPFNDDPHEREQVRRQHSHKPLPIR